MGYENEKAREQTDRHKRRLGDLIAQQQQLANSITNSSSAPSSEDKEEEESGKALELQTLADDRLKELEELQAKYEQAVKVFYHLRFLYLVHFHEN